MTLQPLARRLRLDPGIDDRPVMLRREIVERRELPIEAEIEVSQRSCVVRLPLRGEEIIVERRTVTMEEVVVHPRRVESVERRAATVRREQLRVEATGRTRVDDLDSSSVPGADPSMAETRRIRFDEDPR